MEAIEIFISYAREDYPRVLPIYEILTREGFKPWLDAKDLFPGQNWELAIQQAIERATFFLACMSEKSVNKIGVVQKELKLALDMFDRRPEGSVYIIPVRLEPCGVPSRFRGLHWCDVFEESGIENLVNGIERAIEEQGLTGLVVTVSQGPDAGKRFRSFSNLVTIGRADRSDVLLTDPRVSALHAKIELRGGNVTYYVHLADNNHSIVQSRNGAIKLTADKARSAEINTGDVVKLGESILSFKTYGTARPEVLTTTERE